MQEIKAWTRPLKEILKTPESAEQKLEADRIYRAIIHWRQWPDVAVHTLSGIYVPTHQRLMMQCGHLGAPSTVYVCSRGTSKSAVVDVVYSTYKGVMFPKRKAITLSAGGFRGGQVLFNDAEKWIRGGWSDQEGELDFLGRCARHDKVIHRAQNFWAIEWTSGSTNMTVPTNDPEKIRGLRGNDLYIDEANFADFELMDKVALSFLNVLGDFKTGGENAASNSVFYTTTIDYGWRDFQRTSNAAYDGLARDLAALESLHKKDHATYASYRKKGLLQTMFVSFDYTDTIIRRYVTTRSGERMEISWPDASRRFKLDPRGIPFTVLGENGRLQAQGVPVEVIPTYPINRNIEDKLLSGETAEAIWLAEQRNVVDTSTGDVYPHFVVDAATCKGDRYVLAYEECGADWQKKYDDATHFVPPVMWSCADPCVLGVDYAPGSRDFSAFVVIRIGPCATGEFNPVTGLGKTEWSNVIWAEQHRMTSHADVANKVRELKDRYNLLFYHDPHENDTWKLCRRPGIRERYPIAPDAGCDLPVGPAQRPHGRVYPGPDDPETALPPQGHPRIGTTVRREARRRLQRCQGPGLSAPGTPAEADQELPPVLHEGRYRAGQQQEGPLGRIHVRLEATPRACHPAAHDRRHATAHGSGDHTSRRTAQCITSSFLLTSRPLHRCARPAARPFPSKIPAPTSSVP